ncbi:MAG: hypothetical protein ABI806_07720 [Candidatus Solibacter sp.]
MDEPKLSDELRNMEHEPILPIERKLVAWSIGTGVVLLATLVILSRYF